MTWDEWIEWHMAVSGLGEREGDAQVYALWVEAFRADGFSTVEVVEAVKRILRDDPPRQWLRWLTMIRDAVRIRRSEIARANQKADEQRYAHEICPLCRGGGYVVVPQMDSVIDGTYGPPWHEAVTACRCYKGVRVKAKMDESHAAGLCKFTISTIDSYERRNPNWQRQLRAKEEAQRAWLSARNVSSQADARLGIGKEIATLTRKLKEDHHGPGGTDGEDAPGPG